MTKYIARYRIWPVGSVDFSFLVREINSKDDVLAVRRACEIRREEYFSGMGGVSVDVLSVRVSSSGRFVYRKTA